MNGGWQTITEASGQPFTNQGLCIAYVIHHPVGLADVTSSSFTGTHTTISVDSCGFTFETSDATYPGSAAVGPVSLHIAGCIDTFPLPVPAQFAGSFTITTNVGKLSGSASGPVALQLPSLIIVEQYTLSVDAGTGAFTGTTGSLLFSTTGVYSPSFVGSVTPA